MAEELRNKVYSFCKNDSIVDVKCPQDTGLTLEIDRARHQFLGLTQASKALHREFGVLYRMHNQVRVDARDVYAFLDEVASTASRVDESTEVSKGSTFANFVIDLSPAVNDRDIHIIDVLPLLRLCLAEPDVVCKFEFSGDIDTTHVSRHFQPCDRRITQRFASILVKDLNELVAGPKTLATIWPSNSLLAANLHLKGLGAIRLSRYGIAISRPFLDIRFVACPAWGSLSTGTILRCQDPKAKKFVEDAGLNGILQLPVRTNDSKAITRL